MGKGAQAMKGERLVMLYSGLARLPVGEECEVDARIEHDPEDYPDRPVKPATQGTLEICRINAREIAIGRWRPRGNG
jgi:hypothetical protein